MLLKEAEIPGLILWIIYNVFDLLLLFCGFRLSELFQG